METGNASWVHTLALDLRFIRVWKRDDRALPKTIWRKGFLASCGFLPLHTILIPSASPVVVFSFFPWTVSDAAAQSGGSAPVEGSCSEIRDLWALSTNPLPPQLGKALGQKETPISQAGTMCQVL